MKDVKEPSMLPVFHKVFIRKTGSIDAMYLNIDLKKKKASQ